MLDKELEKFQREANAQIQRDKLRVEAQLLQSQQKTLELEVASALADETLVRANNPYPASGCCPRCWIWDGQIVGLQAAHSSVPDVEIMRCPTCKTEVGLPVS